MSCLPNSLENLSKLLYYYCTIGTDSVHHVCVCVCVWSYLQYTSPSSSYPPPHLDQFHVTKTHFLCLGVVGNKKHMIDRNLLCGIICMRISQNAITYGNCHLSRCISLSIFQSTILVGKCFFYMTLSTTCFPLLPPPNGHKMFRKVECLKVESGWLKSNYIRNIFGIYYLNAIFRGFFLNQWWGTWVISEAHTPPPSWWT